MQRPLAEPPQPRASPSADIWGWLLRLRWGACLGQGVAVAVVRWGLGVPVPTLPLFALILLAAVSNAALSACYAGRPAPGPSLWTAVLVGDVLALTALLSLSGGVANPFISVYTVHVALAATILPVRGLLAVGLAGMMGFFALDALHRPVAAIDIVNRSPLVVRGILCASVLANVFIAYFVGRIQAALARSERRLQRARARAARDEQLSSLAALAAGAAHELSTPLASIAVAAGEMARRLQGSPSAALRDDVALIRSEVERCREILRHMGAGAARNAADSFAHVQPAAFVKEALHDWAGNGRIALQIDPAAIGALYVPRRSVEHSLRAVVRNALEASAAARARPDARAERGGTAGKVAVRVAQVEGTCYISVADDGCGMGQEVVDKLGQPFFTTKELGSGMGLGLFLARDVLERLGGALRVTSHVGLGTTVVLQLPVSDGLPL